MKKKNKSFLVTGGTDSLNITRLLIRKNFKVKVFDNNSRGHLKKFKQERKKFKFIKGDIRNKKQVFKACKNVDAVVHLAYVNGTKYFYKEPVKILEIAVKGILNVIESCIENNIKELYLASSSEVYQTPEKIPTDEHEILKIPDIHNPRYSYGGGKILLSYWYIRKKVFKKLVIFRPHNVYGSDMGSEHVHLNYKRQKSFEKNLDQGNGDETDHLFRDDFKKFYHLKKGIEFITS